MGFDIKELESNIFKSVDDKYLGDFNKKETGEKRITYEYFTNRNKINEFNKNYFNLSKNKFKPEDKILQFCYLFGIYDNIEENYDQIKIILQNNENINLIEMFEIVANFYCRKFIDKFRMIEESVRKRNCELVNLEQEKFLKLKGHNLKFKLTKPERKLVLYFRDLLHGGIFQNSFDFLLICYVLDKYVNFGNSKLFTEINITSRNLYMYPRLVKELFPNLKYKFADNRERDNSFNMLCGVCANTVHFNMGMANEVSLGSIPLLSNATIYNKNKRGTIKFVNNITLKDNINYVKLNINYNKYDRYYTYNKMYTGKIGKIINTIFGTKNYGSKFDLVEEIIRGVSKLEDVVIEQARIKLTNGTYE